MCSGDKKDAQNERMLRGGGERGEGEGRGRGGHP